MIRNIVFDIGNVLASFRWKDLFAELGFTGEKFDRIVVSGGDGMLHELVNAVLRLSKPVAIGYIPTGTVNDFAHTHNIPKRIKRDNFVNDVFEDAGIMLIRIKTNTSYEQEIKMKIPKYLLKE